MWSPTPVTGEVRSAAGEPVAGVPVIVGRQATLTDEHGHFLLWSVPRRARVLEVNSWGFVPLTAKLRTDGPLLERVLTLRLDRSPRLYGQVLDEAGKPLEAHIALFSASRWSPEQIPEETEADSFGRFRLEGLPADDVLLMISSLGYVMGEESLNLRPNSVHRTVERLERERGFLSLTTEPAGATVTVDGTRASCTSPCELRLESGAQHVRVELAKYVPLEFDTHIVHKQQTAVSRALERKKGHLLVNASPGATVFLNGNAVGAAPWEGDVPTDIYTIDVRAAQRWPARAIAEVRWNETTVVEVAGLTVGRHPDRAAWVAGMEAYLGSLGGRYGVAVIDQDGGALFGTHADELFTAASVIKVPIALFAYHEVEGGRLKLDDQWEMLSEDVSDGTGVLQSEAPGTKFTVARLLDVLIRQSDNTAAAMFRRVLTIEKIDAYMADLGAPNSRQVAVTTPRETASLFYQLWRGNILTPAHRDELLGLLQTTAFNDRIPAGVPSGVPVAHKIGMYGSALNDAGIIFAGRPYILAVFTDTADWDAAAETTRVISAALYEFEQ
jgi:beta-lactamase class A